MTRFASAPFHLVEDFKRHVRETGQPETYSAITNAPPPVEGEIVALWTDIEIPRARRPGRDKAPCWICNNGKPKWLHGGTLIWSAASEHIYAIGPDCYAKHFDSSLDVALNVLRQTQQHKLNVERLVSGVARAPPQLAWIAAHRSAAESADRLHQDLARSAPGFRRSVSRQLKSTNTTLRGIDVLQGSWALGQKLSDASQALWRLQARIGDVEPEGWAKQLAPSQVEERLLDVRSIQTTLQTVFARLTEAAEFSAGENLRLMAAWSRAATIPFTMSTTATQFEIRCEKEYVRCRANLARPKPLP